MCFWDRAAGLVVLLVLFTPFALLSQSDESPVLNAGEAEQIASAGYYSLVWTSPAGPTMDESPVYELVESTDAAFTDATVQYRGPDLATTISGRPNGTYYYRVRRTDQPSTTGPSWSNVHRVVVEHHSIGRAVTFLIIGGLVFAATLVVVLWGNRAERQETHFESA
jgi:hypothetical protein